MQRHRFTIGRIPIDPVTRAEALAAIDALITRGRGGFVVTPNVDHIVMAHGHEGMRAACAGASLSLADGQPVVWMAKMLGTPVPERVSGSDLIDPLMGYAAARGRRVFFFGTTPAVSHEAERRLVARYPSLRIVGRDCSFWPADDRTAPDASAVVQAVRRSGADLVIVALNAPRQHLWMARHAQALSPAVAIGLGASLDFVAGAVARAPAWVSHAGLEWLFRLAQEPRRLAYRYLVRDPQILPIFAADVYRKLRGRVSRNGPIGDASPVIHRES